MRQLGVSRWRDLSPAEDLCLLQARVRSRGKYLGLREGMSVTRVRMLQDAGDKQGGGVEETGWSTGDGYGETVLYFFYTFEIFYS